MDVLGASIHYIRSLLEVYLASIFTICGLVSIFIVWGLFGVDLGLPKHKTAVVHGTP